MPTLQPPSRDLACAQTDVSDAVWHVNMHRMRGATPPAGLTTALREAGLRLREEHARATARKHGQAA